MLQRQNNRTEDSREISRPGILKGNFFHRKKISAQEPEPVFGLISGACGLPKAVGISGDSYIFRKLTNTLYMAAVADGMGTGRAASDCSRFVLENLYQLLRVGRSPLEAVVSVNTAIPFSISSECFSTVDMAVFDLEKGICSIYKAGGAPSFIQRGEQAGILKMPALPIGIIEEPDIKYTTFAMEHGDRYFFMSDGVTEAPPADPRLSWAEEIILEHSAEPPRAISERLLRGAALRYGQSERDDMTVVAIEVI